MTRAVFQLQNMTESDPAGRPAEVAVTGEIDVTNADDFARSVRELSGAGPVILELSRLDYLDSAGFAAVYGLQAQGAVVVLSRKSLIHKAAELMELPFHDDAEAARRALDGC